MNWKKRSGLALLAMLGAANFAVADDTESSRASLKGLRGVNVRVEELSPVVEQTGLTRTAIKIDAELRLRLAGIHILTSEESLKTPGMPTLYIHVIIATSGATWRYSLSVELDQSVRLDRDTAVALAGVTTWSADAGSGFGPPSSISARVQDTLKEQVDRFVNAYVSVNPKE